MISLPYLCRKTDITLSYVTNSLQEKKIQNKNCNIQKDDHNYLKL